MIIQNVLSAIPQKTPEEESFYIADDGLRHCKVCKAPMEVIVKMRGVKIRCACICKCGEETLNSQKEAGNRRQIAINRDACFRGSKYAKALFSNSEESEYLRIAKNYVKNFDRMRSSGKGLLLYGSIGTGKSHVAACICNQLINEGYLCRMTSLSTLVNEMQSLSFNSKGNYIDLMRKYDLIVFDDLGIERETGYMNEQVFQIIDSRVNMGLPMIVTTNLTMAELSQADKVEQRRVYQRILEHCHPIEIKGQSKRMQKAIAEFDEMEKLLRGE